MDEEGQGVHGLAIQIECDFLDVGDGVMAVLVVERGVPLRLRFELVEEVEDELG